MVRESDFVVVDDPQLCALIPTIKRVNPSCTVAYRSHIQIQSQLIRDHPESAHAKTWNYLWDRFVSHADLLIAHPFAEGVPHHVPKARVGFMPATSPPLDGLNKAVPSWDRVFYQRLFSRLACDQGGSELHLSLDKYIIQIARFDPSKGH